MRRKLRYTIIVFILTFKVFLLNGQLIDHFLQTLNDKLSSYVAKVPFEDIYLQSDRESYIAGEYVWFNACLFNRNTLSLSNESSYAYVELLDQDNKPVSQTKVRLEDGTGGGEFRLPDSLYTGEYTLRAYTSLMKNFLPSGCFMKRLTVYNPFSDNIFKTIRAKFSPTGSECNILFSPEGGRLLNGFINRVGVRVFDNDGRKRKFNGYLSDGINDTLKHVTIDSTGLGSFEFLPQPGKNYRLISDDRKCSVYLPVISQSGFSLNVKTDVEDTLKLTVNSENVFGAGMNYFYLVIVSNGKILFNAKKTYSDKISTVSLPGNILYPGINQITLFDPDGNPVCNRCIFRPINLNENVILKTGTKFKKREKIDIEISIDSNLISNTAMTDFSLSVSAINGGNMSSDLLRYLIAGDEFYSEGGDVFDCHEVFSSSPEMIDNFLLSVKSGWIKWEDIMKDKYPFLKYTSEKGISHLSGFYRNSNTSEANFKKILYLSIPGKIPLFRYAETDIENHFSFAIRDYDYSEEYIIQPSEPDNNYSVQIESPFPEIYPISRMVYDTLRKKLPAVIANWSVNYQVEKIYGISNMIDTIISETSKSDRIRFYGKPDQEVIMSDYISLPAMQEVFFELIPGVSIRNRKSKNGIFIQNPVTKNYYYTPPLMLVDGVIINDPSEIINMDPELVEKIDIIKDEYIVGDIIFSGIISVITKTGDFTSVSLPANAIRISDKSHTSFKRFKSPDYSKTTNINNRIPDFRNTLFWGSNIKPDRSGKIYVSFYTSDYASKYEINLRGVSGSRLYTCRKTIQVE